MPWWTKNAFQINHHLIRYFSPFFFVLLCFFNKPGRFLPASPGTTGARFPRSLCSGISPETRGLRRQRACCRPVILFSLFFFLKKKVKEHTGVGGSAPALPLELGDAPLAAPGLPAGRCGVSCLPAWIAGAGCLQTLEGASTPAGCPEASRAAPHPGRGWMHQEDAAGAAASPRALHFV